MMTLSPKQFVRINICLTALWILLAVPTFIFWSHSLEWIVFMSLYANIAASFSGFMGARSNKTSSDAADAADADRNN
jgi:hypothetical protein